MRPQDKIDQAKVRRSVEAGMSLLAIIADDVQHFTKAERKEFWQQVSEDAQAKRAEVE